MFFGGLLSLCRLQFGKAESYESSCEQIILEEEIGPRSKRAYLTATIHIITDQNAKKDVFTTIQNSLDTLLHKQLHAVIHLHTCLCEKGCWDEIDYEKKSHGVEWLAAALAIERAATPLLGWPVKLYRNQRLASDIHFLGYRMPNDALLRALDLDAKYILSTVDWYRVHSDEGANEHRVHLPLKKNRCLRDTWTVDGWGEKGFQNNEWLLW